MTHDTFDGIILGAGHNGLILQAYLSRAGLKTVSLDRLGVAGGGLSTLEHPEGSGFLHNIHSFYHRGLTQMPWFDDLELRRHGAEYVEPELNVALVTRDGRVLEWWRDFEKTFESLAQFSPNDAEALRRWRDAFRPVVQNILVPEAQSPPLPPEQRRALLSETNEGRLLLDVSRLSPVEFVRREFEHPVVQAGLLFFNGLREVDLRAPGFGHHIPALFASGRMAQMCVGGSKRLADALVNVIEKSGGEILLHATPHRIIVEGGRAISVETTDGRTLHAKRFIASSLNPQQTFLELIDERVLPSGLAGHARAYRYNLLAPLFSLHLNLREPPRYSAFEKHPELARALMIIVGLEHPDQFEQIVRHHEAGTIPPTVMWGSCPTMFDSTQAPAGRHTAFMWEKLPYRIHGNANDWDKIKTQHGQELLRVWKEYSPNLETSVLDHFMRSPLDVERTLPNMKEGDLLVGSLAHGQIGYNRPFAGAGEYRTPLQGLYLCGSCCHPGGNITGLPGYNCAQVILKDLGVQRRNAAGQSHDGPDDE